VSKIIIGIHGLGNKPPQDLLEKWWRKAIEEGLERINCSFGDFKFKLIYWADLLHPVPLDPNEKDEDSDLYIKERYIPNKQNRQITKRGFKEDLINFFNRQRDKILFNESIHRKFLSFTDFIIKHFFKDLEIYFTQQSIHNDKSDFLAKDIIRERITETLKGHSEQEILLIAHSMGSIVSYDVLVHSENDIKIDTHITIGSPLGVPFIFNKLKDDTSISSDDNNKLRTPENILNEWANLADPEDKLARSADLSKLFKINSHNIAPVMELVNNDYESEGIENPHKSYGYLRTPEIAQIIDEFLSRDKNRFVILLSRMFNHLKIRLTKS
jgi:hypothetical protein